MRRIALAAALLLFSSLVVSPSHTSIPGAAGPVFEIVVPDRMVTGNVLLQANVKDESVDAVKWVLGDWARTTRKPFELAIDLGPIPAERKVRAVALDARRQALYERVAVLNRGGRSLGLEFVTPLHGQRATGAVEVRANVQVPLDDAITSVSVGDGEREVALDPVGGPNGIFAAMLEVSSLPTPLIGRVKTRRGRMTETSILLNTRGVTTSSDAHVVEQMVSVTKGGAPVENLRAGDFTVTDERGTCEIREVRLVKDTPLSVGFAVDTSISLAHNKGLLRETATRFLEQCFREGDAGFLYGFGPVVSRKREWTDSRATLVDGLGSLADTELAGTVLYEAIVKSLYQFQGSQGARALLLVTDGEDYEGDVPETDALAYARQSGVPIYALALTSRSLLVDARRGTVDPNGRFVEQRPNMTVLSRFSDATGGRTYLVKRGEDLRGVFTAIEREIRTQYLVSYVSSAKTTHRFHPVRVHSRVGTVRTAAGFFY